MIRPVLTELAFGNRVLTLNISGRALKAAIENGLSQLPAASGRFPQVSGLAVEAAGVGFVGQTQARGEEGARGPFTPGLTRGSRRGLPGPDSRRHHPDRGLPALVAGPRDDAAVGERSEHVGRGAVGRGVE